MRGHIAVAAAASRTATMAEAARPWLRGRFALRGTVAFTDGVS